MKPAFAKKDQISDTTSAKERILFTAHDLFYQNGIRNTGVDRIISESKVTKTTFYRHFPSKNTLINSYLEDRHQSWVTWFRECLAHHGNAINSLYATLNDWFSSDIYRGCAFINAMGEMDNDSTHIISITKTHKQDVIEIIKDLLDDQEHIERNAQRIAMAVDGAIVRAQFDRNPQPALTILEDTVQMILTPIR